MRVPEILATDCAAGTMLLEDVGSRTLYERRQRGWSYLAPLVERAASLIPRFQRIDRKAVEALNPPLDHTLMSTELATTWKVALGAAGLAELGLPAALETALATMLERTKSPVSWVREDPLPGASMRQALSVTCHAPPAGVGSPDREEE